MATFISNSAGETLEFGRQFANDLQAGAVLALQGDLGAGKTQFTKGVVAGLGSQASVTSPTFTIIHEYGGGRLPVYHFDFFRLEERERLVRLGLDEYFFSEGVCLVEWADRFADLVPEQARWIRFDVTGPEQRAIEIK